MKTIYLIIAWALAIPTLGMLVLFLIAGTLSVAVIYVMAMGAEWALDRSGA